MVRIILEASCTHTVFANRQESGSPCLPCQVKLCSIAEMSPDVFAILPDVVWYLTQNGRDMWCRVPYGFFFSSAEAAAPAKSAKASVNRRKLFDTLVKLTG